MTIYLDAPNLGESEKAKLNECVDSTYVSTAGPFVPEFEEVFARYHGVEDAVSVQSGTAALHIALVELGVGPGDEVIVPALTFAASVNPVLYTGATPVLVDVDPKSWTLDPEKTEAALTARTKVILPVHLYGNPCDMDSLTKIAGAHKIALLEDATESLGGTWRGQPTGTLGDFGCFSFNGNKLITTGGGGMVVGKDRGKMKHIRFLVNQARDASRGYFHSELGYNYRMTNLEASLGLAQMERIEEFLTKKKRFAAIYREVLQDLKEVTFQKESDCCESAWWLSSLTYTGGPIAEVQEKLKERGIPTRRLFSPLSSLPYLKGFTAVPCPQAELIYEQGLNLPSSTVNSEKEVLRAAETLREVLLERRRGNK